MKEQILEQMHFRLANEDYDGLFRLFSRYRYTAYAEMITERLHDYLRLQCADSYDRFCHIKGLLQSMSYIVDEFFIDSLFYRSVLCRDYKKMRFYHAYGANIHAWNDVAVRLSFEINDYALAKELIEMGADVCANGGQTLKAAIKHQDTRMCALIAKSLMHKENVRNFLQ